MNELLAEITIHDFIELIETGIVANDLTKTGIAVARATLSQVNMTPMYCVLNTNGHNTLTISDEMREVFEPISNLEELANKGHAGTLLGLPVYTDAFLDFGEKFVTSDCLIFTSLKYHKEGLIIPERFPKPIGIDE